MNIKHFGQQLLRKGIKTMASDLYLFPSGEQVYELKFRYHDKSYLEQEVSREEADKLIAFFKYLGGMDVSEKRKVQVGGTTVARGKKNYRIRLSTVADYLNRETLVIRFLYSRESGQKLRYILPEQWLFLTSQIKNKGLYLFSGPTGAGKTTTMYCLAHTFFQERQGQILTIEDPVEITDAAFLQFQVNEKIGLTYEELVKVCLRHRPDLLIIGEIRDESTARMALQAALTGHLVFSTIHAKDKQNIRQRLLDLKASPIVLDQCIQGMVYQELLPLASSEQEYGVLYDLTFQKQEVTTWEKSLNVAYKQQKITQKTYQLFSTSF